MNKALVLFINKFHPISLDEMNSVALMKRTDTKYVINISSLSKVLEKLSETYKVLEIKEQRIMNYSSLYLDTKEFKFYHDHHNGIVNRTKIRQRKYVDSDLTFLEIKKKNGKGETNKFRIKINDFETKLSDKSKKFISEITNEDYNLQTSLWNSFNRITLVNLKENERVTIDFNLTYTVDDKEKKYSNLAVIELKQSRFDRKSLVVKVLKSIGHNPYSISKYCIGVANLYQNLKHNIFKPKLLKINNI
ncbi:VTC domain-containing protein [Polaribacter sp. KT25b]|uniref:polyphosphate polymerase domain-containing protein n=1 Tax=Polaribacter sp. KT25b TaxID=1855336 RepID=UPI00087CADE3|nr:polyphosphate polymerase domain-containing protein [Polaribacter sp. KT25b]SDR66797.1 VTC domain-containing protein [Polaribacter sp. KT25b]